MDVAAKIFEMRFTRFGDFKTSLPSTIFVVVDERKSRLWLTRPRSRRVDVVVGIERSQALSPKLIVKPSEMQCRDKVKETCQSFLQIGSHLADKELQHLQFTYSVSTPRNPPASAAGPEVSAPITSAQPLPARTSANSHRSTTKIPDTWLRSLGSDSDQGTCDDCMPNGRHSRWLSRRLVRHLCSLQGSPAERFDVLGSKGHPFSYANHAQMGQVDVLGLFFAGSKKAGISFGPTV
nr:hypothetical protein CFP56_69461 [Quercus suber]